MSLVHHDPELIDIALVACVAQSFRRSSTHQPALIVECLFQNYSITRVGAAGEQPSRKGPHARGLNL